MSAFHHHQVTSDTTQGGTTTFGDDKEYQTTRAAGTVDGQQETSAVDNTRASTTADDITTAPSSDDPRLGTFQPQAHGLYSEYAPRTEFPERHGSLSSTPGPFQVPTTDDLQGTSVPPSSSVSSQNAPGKAGEFGEKVMGALGVGGTHVERPKEEQGIGEKIVNFLGA